MLKDFQKVLSKAKMIKTTAGIDALAIQNVDGNFHLALVKGAEMRMGTQRIKNAMPVFLVEEAVPPAGKPAAKKPAAKKASVKK